MTEHIFSNLLIKVDKRRKCITIFGLSIETIKNCGILNDFSCKLLREVLFLSERYREKAFQLSGYVVYQT